MRKSIVFLLAAVMTIVLFTGCSMPADVTEPTTETQSGTFTVKFDLNDGGVGTIDSQTVEAGGLAVQPAEPIRDDYVFEGWYSDSELTTAFKFAENKIEADTTLYAKWSEAVYYVAGNFTGYEPKMAGYGMKPIAGKDGWYWLTVELTEEVRDTTYDGHYYKITNGTWAADGCWGADSYALQPAPESPTGGGLGSIWIEDDCTLAVCFDSINKVIYDDSIVQAFATPRIYGDFNTAMGRGTDWSTADGEALELADADGDGIFTGLYEIPAYSGPSEDGYSMIVALSQKYYINEYGNALGASEQYLFDGSAAGMGSASYLMPDKDTVYEFAYDSATHVTTATLLEADQIKELAGPTVYGDFSLWQFEGGGSVVLKDDDGDGVYTGTLNLSAYTGTDKGYMIAVALSKKLYNDEYGIRWGAEEQYLFDGSVAAMGSVSYLNPEKDTTYTLSYDSTTHVTTVAEK